MLTLALDIYASIFNKILEVTDPGPRRKANSAKKAAAARWKAAKQTLTWKAYQTLQVAGVWGATEQKTDLRALRPPQDSGDGGRVNVEQPGRIGSGLLA